MQPYILVNNIIYKRRGDYYYPEIPLSEYDTQITDPAAKRAYEELKKQDISALVRIEEERGIMNYFSGASQHSH